MFFFFFYLYFFPHLSSLSIFFFFFPSTSFLWASCLVALPHYLDMLPHSLIMLFQIATLPPYYALCCLVTSSYCFNLMPCCLVMLCVASNYLVASLCCVLLRIASLPQAIELPLLFIASHCLIILLPLPFTNSCYVLPRVASNYFATFLPCTTSLLGCHHTSSTF
jgi:hypothetical protein